MLIKLSYSPPPPNILHKQLGLERLARFEHVVQSLLYTCPFWCLLLDSHLTPYLSNVCVQLKQITKLSISMLGHCLLHDKSCIPHQPI